MKKHLFADVECRDQLTPRDALMSVMHRTIQHVDRAQSARADQGEVLTQVKRCRDARRLARLRRCRKTAEKIDVANKENVGYSKHSVQSDSAAAAATRRRDMLPSTAELRPVTCSRDPPRHSSQFAKFFEDVPLSGRCRLAGRGVDSRRKTLLHSADSCTEARPRRVPDLPVVVEGRAAGDDTSVWSAVSHGDDGRPRSTTVDSLCVSPPELSRISSEEQDELREQTSSGDLTGAFHSTFSYPLHSTLLTAAVTAVDLSSVAEADAAGRDLEVEPTDADPAQINTNKSASTVSDVEAAGAHKVCPTSGGFRFNHHVATGEVDHIRTTDSSQSGGQMAMTLRSLRYAEAGKHAEPGGRASNRVMPYFPPLYATTVNASSTSSAVVAVNVPLEQHNAVAASAAADDDDLRTVLDSHCRRRTHHVDASLEAVRGSPCVNDHHDPAGLDVASRLTPNCRRCHLDALTAGHTAHTTTNYRREGLCVSAKSTSKSGGRGTTPSQRMARETGRGDLRHTFTGSPPQQHDRCQSLSLTSREVLRVYRSQRGRTADNWQCPRVYQRPRQRQRRPARRRCRCGTVQGQNMVNFVDLRTDARRAVLSPGESGNERRSERYLDRVRKRTLVNRLKQFSGCFCDTGCGRRMRTLANV